MIKLIIISELYLIYMHGLPDISITDPVDLLPLPSAPSGCHFDVGQGQPWPPDRTCAYMQHRLGYIGCFFRPYAS